MREETIIYEKEGVTLSAHAYKCMCSGQVRELGYAGCSHDDHLAHFFQCEKCKRVEILPQLRGATEKELLEGGWTKLA